MAEEQTQNSTQSEIAKLRADLEASQREQANIIMQTVTTQMNSILDGRKDAEKEVESLKETVVTGDMQEFEEEVRSLGIDEKQTKALLSMMNKITEKKAPKIKKEINSEIEEKQTRAQTKQTYEMEAATYYPQVLDKNSALFKQSQVEFNSLDAYSAKSPSASYLAVTRAAAKLGIPPVTKSQLRAQEARNESGDGSSSKKSDKMTDRQSDFGQFFGIDPKLMQEKLRLVSSEKKIKAA